MQDAGVEIAQLGLIAVALVLRDRALHAGAGDERIRARLQIDGQVVAVHALGDLREHPVLLRGRGLQLVLALPDGIVLFDEEVQDVREEMIGALHLRFALAPDAGEHVLNPLFVQTEPHGSAQNLPNVLIVGEGLTRQHAAEPLSVRQHDGNREIAEAQGTDVDSLALRLPGGRAAGQSTLTVMNHLAELRHAEGLRRAPALRIDDDGGHAGALGPVLNQLVELVHVAKFLKAQSVVPSVGFRFRSVGRVHGGSSSYVNSKEMLRSAGDSHEMGQTGARTRLPQE